MQDSLVPLSQTVEDDFTWGMKYETISLIYSGCLLTVCSLVILIFFNRGFWVTTGVLSYILALSTMTISVKSVFVHQHFHFPMFVTSTHFLFSGILCFGIMKFKQKREGTPMAVPTRRQIGTVILPIAISFAASVGANNLALVHSNAAFAEMIGGAAPLCVMWINVMEGKGFHWHLLSPVLAVIAGVCFCVHGELKFTRLGFGLISTATFLRAYKSSLQHRIMEQNTDIGTLEPVELLAWMSIPCFSMMSVLGLLTEGLDPFRKLHSSEGLRIGMAIGVTVVNACVLNVANNFVIRDLGAVGCLLAGQLKGILLLMGAAVLLGEVIQRQQIIGYLFIAGGVYFYNKMEKNIKDEFKKNKKELEAVQRKVSEALKEGHEEDLEKIPLVT